MTGRTSGTRPKSPRLTCSRLAVTRGDLVESEHRIHAVVWGPTGPELVWGDVNVPTTLRSAAKLFQALPLVEDGVVDALPLSESELALCCASHNTEPAHVAGARAILAKVGVDEEALACGPHRPLDPDAARALDLEGTRPSPIHNNCSGKHAGMLALAVHHGWATDGYHRPDHPVQLRMRTEIGRWADVDPTHIPTGVDGCGIPCYGLPLERVARAFRSFGSGEHEGPERLLDAVARAPFMIGGTGRLCSRLPEVTGGRIVAKVGAEGVYGAVVRDVGFGVALKVEDGSRRAVEPALVAVLESVGALSSSELAELRDFRTPAVTNTRGETVGEIRLMEADGPGDPGSAVAWDRRLETLVRVSAAVAADSEEALEHSLVEADRICEPVEVEEALLQCYLFLGFPSALNAFAVWRRVSGRAAPDVSDDVGADPLAAWRDRGEHTCRRVYGNAYDGLRENIRGLQPDLDRWMVLEGYGKVLSRPGLALGQRECCIAAILAVRGATVQFRSHLRGAVRCGLDVDGVDRLLEVIDPYLNEATRRDAHAVRDVVIAREER